VRGDHVGAAVVLACLALSQPAIASPQLEAGVGVGSGIELSGTSTTRSPGFVVPRLAVLSRGPMPGGSSAFYGSVAVPVSIESRVVGIQPGVGYLWRPSIDYALGLGGSVIVGVLPVRFGLLEVSATARYYLTVGVALAAEVAADVVWADPQRFILGGSVGVVVDFDLGAA